MKNFSKAFLAVPVFTIFMLQACSSGSDSDDAVAPSFTAPTSSSVTANSVVINGSVDIDDSQTIVASGVCLKTSQNPTVNDLRLDNALPLGDFSLTVTGLNGDTQYYARPFAIVGSEVFYGSQITFTTLAAVQYEIGDLGPGGGFVFYLDGTGQHGMEIAPASTQFQTQWGCYTTSVAGTSAAFGQGQANTTKILNYHANINFYANPAQCQQVVLSTGDVAAKKCADLVHNGFDDWYLPSEDELKMVRNNLYAQGLGDFDNDVFISSTEKPGQQTMAMCIQLDNNTTWGMYKYNLTDYRAVRNF